MLIDRKHMPWGLFTLALAGAAMAAYLLDPQARLVGGQHGGSTLVGIVLGSAALAVMLFCAGLSLKRRVPHWRVGRTQSWLRGHIWLGMLSVWLVALHAAFRMGGALTTWLWIILAIVTFSALFGLILQQFIPRLLLHSVPGETVAQQLSRQLDSVSTMIEKTVKTYAGSLDQPAPPWSPEAALSSETAAALAAESSGASGSPSTATAAPAKPAAKKVDPNSPPAGGEPLRRCYEDFVRPYVEGRSSSPLGSRARAESIFVAIKTMTPAHIHPGVEELRDLCERRRQLLRQRRLMSALHGWLIFHVPLSWGLLALVIIHAVWALRFLPQAPGG